MLALTKSHRVGVNPNIIMFGKKKSQIKGVVKNKRLISKLEVSITDECKVLKLNQTEIKKREDNLSFFLLKQKVLCFCQLLRSINIRGSLFN